MDLLTPLYLPALKGQIGDWNYYITLMKFKDIGTRIKYAEEIYKSSKLNELLQREVLGKRAKDIAEYLLNQEQRFLNSITVGVFGGKPKWMEFKIDNKKDDQPESIPLKEEGIFGYLKFSGEELLFAIDGQHRVAGIRNALALNNTQKFIDEEVSVIFIGHERTTEGAERTRRLFTTLNRYAKPVSLKHIIALDEDDIIAICTRELIEKHRLFLNDNISLSTGSSISPKDYKCFTNIVTLYKCNDLLLSAFFKMESKKWKDFKRVRPTDADIENAKKYIDNFWSLLIKNFPIIDEYLSTKEHHKNNFRYRNENGGNILFRPIGLLTYIKAIYYCLKAEWKLNDILAKLYRINQELNEIPWKGVLWEPISKRMNVRDANQKLSLRLILYMIHYDIGKIKRTSIKLKEEYASILNKEQDEVTLPEKIMIRRRLKKKN